MEQGQGLRRVLVDALMLTYVNQGDYGACMRGVALEYATIVPLSDDQMNRLLGSVTESVSLAQVEAQFLGLTNTELVGFLVAIHRKLRAEL